MPSTMRASASRAASRFHSRSISTNLASLGDARRCSFSTARAACSFAFAMRRARRDFGTRRAARDERAESQCAPAEAWCSAPRGEEMPDAEKEDVDDEAEDEEETLRRDMMRSERRSTKSAGLDTRRGDAQIGGGNSLSRCVWEGFI